MSSPSARPAANRRGRLERAAWVSGQLLVVLLCVGAVGWALLSVRVVVIPLALAAVLSSVLLPPTELLVRHARFPRGLAAGVTLLVVFVVVFATAALLGLSFTAQLDDVGREIGRGFDQLGELVVSLPLGVTRREWTELTQEPMASVGAGASVIARELGQGARTVVATVTEALLTVVFAFFLTKDGKRIARWFLDRLPTHLTDGVERAGSRGILALRGYVVGLAVIGLANAAVFGLCLWALGMPLVLPLTLLTLIGSMIPMVGPTVAGAVAMLVALPAGGMELMFFVFAAAVIVQQIEGNLLQPVVMGRAVELHPMVVLMAITGGVAVLGVAGAFISVPAVASGWAAWGAWHEREDEARQGVGGASEAAADAPAADRPDAADEMAAEAAPPGGRRGREAAELPADPSSAVARSEGAG